MATFKAAWIQGKSQGNLDRNLIYYTEKIKYIAKDVGAYCNTPLLVVLPELFLWDYFPITEDKKHFNTATGINSEMVKHFQSLAKELKIVLTLPIFEKRIDGLYHNSILLIENGEIVGHYRKMHIPDDPGFYEKYYFTPGDLGFVVCKTSLGKIGLLICWDQWFPEAARINALKGADIILYPTAIAWDKKDSKETHKQELESWKMVMQSHAISNNIYVMAVNRVGEEGHLTFWGNSFLADPFGKIIQQDDLEEKIAIVDIDTSLKEESRRIWPFFRDRRIEKYDSLLKVCDET